MLVGTAFHKADLSEKYDAIVIGSGMGGLSTAAILSTYGQKVLVLERHYTAGGFTHTFARKGYEWDVGVHYIGEVHRENSILRKIFDFVSGGQLEWAPMAKVYDRIYLGDESFDYVAGTKNFRAKMISYFPEEGKAIDAYLNLLRKVNRASSLFFMERALPPQISRFVSRTMTADYLKYATQTTEAVMLSLTENRKLIRVLTGQWGDYGLPPDQSSFAMHAIVAKHYLSGASYPVGGSSSIARSIEQVIKKSGGQILTRAEVASIIMEGNTAKGVRLKSGQEIFAKSVVSSVGVLNTFKHLVPEAAAIKHGFDKKLNQVGPSMAHISIYIGIKGTTEELGLTTTNQWIYPKGMNGSSSAKDGLDFPVVYVSFPSSKDPQWAAKHPGKSTVEIVAPVPYEWFKNWESTAWRKRGEDYEKLKQSIADHLFRILFEKNPQLEGKIAYFEVATPLSTAHFSNYETGEIYGIDHSPKRFSEKWLRARTPIKNLFLTGQDIVTCGVGGALCAGVLTAISVLGVFRSIALLKMLVPSYTVRQKA